MLRGAVIHFRLLVVLVDVGHQVLVSGICGDLRLETSILFLGSRTSSDVLSRGAGNQVDLLSLITIGTLAAFDDLDAVDLVLLVFLLNQTHSCNSLMENTVGNRIRPTSLPGA